MKKFFSALLAGLILAMPVSASAATMRDKTMESLKQAPAAFMDVLKTHPNFVAVAYLFEREVIKGYPDGTFKPDSAVNRAELVKMVVVMLYGEPAGEDVAKYKNCFPDVTTEWFAPYICLAKEQGWVQGYPDGMFKPGNSVNRVEAIKIILNVMIAEGYWPSPTETEKQLPLPADADSGAWYTGHLMFSVAKELLDGQHMTEDASGYYYKPGEPMTRKEVAEMIFRTWLYMAERIEYAELIVETACFYLENADLPEDEAMDLWDETILQPLGYTREDADALTVKYSEDDVLNLLIVDATKVKCGDAAGVDMTKWDGLKIYGM